MNSDFLKQQMKERAERLQQLRLQQQQSEANIAVLPPPAAARPVAAVVAANLPRVSIDVVPPTVPESVFSRLEPSRSTLLSSASLPEQEEIERKRKPVVGKPKKQPFSIFADEYIAQHPELQNDAFLLQKRIRIAYKNLTPEERQRINEKAEEKQQAAIVAQELRQLSGVPEPTLQPPKKKRRVVKPPEVVKPNVDFDEAFADLLLGSSSSSSSTSLF